MTAASSGRVWSGETECIRLRLEAIYCIYREYRQESLVSEPISAFAMI
jgi:hypothetical protein